MPKTYAIKKEWRRLSVEMFGLVSRADRVGLDERLNRRVADYIAATGARRLLGFAPMLDEPDLGPFFRDWLAGGGRLALPVWLGGDEMVIRWVESFDNCLRPGRGGTLEPVDTLPEARPEELDIVIAPGRFFSETCQRMGRGAGVYDALFRRHKTGRLGVAYEFQIFPNLPVSEDDVDVDLVATPSRLILKGSGSPSDPLNKNEV
ncbi:MAG: 5-formyltetrahydrofolate cyclo-ligase [Planctomycetaceae bacterium]|nr:5-formyltetrahydrofolate cyclo-ligase [Planctomycetaceae bacterium]